MTKPEYIFYVLTKSPKRHPPMKSIRRILLTLPILLALHGFDQVSQAKLAIVDGKK